MAEFNYFNYFTEIEEYFWKKRGAHLLVSPLDWAILETWQKAGIPVNAVLKGIDRAFDSYARSRRAAAGRQLKSLAYCVDSVFEAAAEAEEAATGKGPEARGGREAAQPFSREELSSYFAKNGQRLRISAEKARAEYPEIAARLVETAARLEGLSLLLDAPGTLDLEDLERRLTILEDKLLALLSSGARDETLLEIRRQMDRSLAPFRHKMTVEQLAQLARQYTHKRLFEVFGIPRLSLFYLT